MGTLSSRRNPNSLSLNKAIKNIPLDVDLMELIILELGPGCLMSAKKCIFGPLNLH
jgi:hypothetical protein